MTKLEIQMKLEDKKKFSEMKELPGGALAGHCTLKRVQHHILLNSVCKNHDESWLQYHVI